MQITIEPPKMYPKQQAMVNSDARYVICEGSVKSGKTVSMVWWLLSEALKFNDGKYRELWWVAPIYEQARIGYNRFVEMFDVQHGNFNLIESKTLAPLKIKLYNNSWIIFKSAEKSQRLYGAEVYGMVIDEATRIKEEAWHQIRTTTTFTQARIRIIGNMRGTRNWVHQLGNLIENGDFLDGEYHKITILDAIEAGFISQQEYDDAKAILPAETFNQDYLCIPMADASNPFGLEHIRSCFVLEKPRGVPYYFGIDLAQTVDYTVISGLDIQGNVVYFDRFKGLDWGVVAKKIEELINKFPNAKFLIDNTGVGSGIVEELARKYISIVEGFKFNGFNQQLLISSLILAIQNHRIKFNDKILFDELANFEYTIKNGVLFYSAPDGYHDDCVMALALAVTCWINNIGNHLTIADGVSVRNEWGAWG